MGFSTTSPVLAQSHCVRVRNGLVLSAVLAFVFAFLGFIAGGVLLSEAEPAIGWPLLVLGVALLVAAVPLFRRGQFPVDVVLTATAVALEPVGRSLKLGYAAESLPLSSIGSYSTMEHNNGLQLKLYLTDKRVLVLNDQNRLTSGPDAAFAPLAELTARLQSRLQETGVPARQRPNFFQGTAGTVLAVLCGGCMLVGVGLMFVPGVEWTQSLRLFTFSAIYLGMYWRNRKPVQ